MGNLTEKLKNPFDGLKANDENGFIKECYKIAEELLNHYCIQCGKEKYYFAEVEFYYFDQNRFNKKWNEVTYERDGYNSGDLFYHLSGMDICFNSHLFKINGRKSGYGGGILIRSIIDTKDEITVGPLTCVNKMLNACKDGNMPKLVFISETRHRIIKETYRYLGKKDFQSIIEKKNKDGEFKLAYYDLCSEEAWNKARSSYYKERLVKYNENR